MNGGSFTFTPDAAGSYVIRAGIEVNGGFSTAQINVTVQEEPKPLTSISVSGTGTITVGGSTQLNASVQNKEGDVTWSCDETSWTATGDQVTFTANQEGTYHLRARNNGAEAVFTLTVSPAPTPAPTPTPSRNPESDEGIVFAALPATAQACRRLKNRSYDPWRSIHVYCWMLTTRCWTLTLPSARP